MNKTNLYHPKEELWNVITHGFGLILSIGALVFLLVYSSLYLTLWHIIGFSIYGASLVLLYGASTAYHASKKLSVRRVLNILDHSAIYVLIAGTYTPFLLVTLRGPWGWSLLGIVWGMTIAGIIFKFFFINRFDRLSTALYLLMGWLVIVAFYPLIKNLELGGLIYLILGGLFYSVGAFFYMKSKIYFNHAIFHVFVLLGSISHFISISLYV